MTYGAMPRATLLEAVQMPKSEITPADFEKYIRDWISENLGVEESQVKEVSHLGIIEGPGGTYKIDVLVRLTILHWANIVVLTECKHLNRPVERYELQVLESKLRDAGAHKGIIFSTSRFHRGAVRYAKAHGIALVHVAIPTRAETVVLSAAEMRCISGGVPFLPPPPLP
jgi:restriction system protein